MLPFINCSVIEINTTSIHLSWKRECTLYICFSDVYYWLCMKVRLCKQFIFEVCSVILHILLTCHEAFHWQWRPAISQDYWLHLYLLYRCRPSNPLPRRLRFNSSFLTLYKLIYLVLTYFYVNCSIWSHALRLNVLLIWLSVVLLM